MEKNTGKPTRTYELVARTNGSVYSMKLQREKTWRHIEERQVPDYVPFKNYTPHHLKDLKLGLKLFLKDHWPAFAKRLKYLESAREAE